MEALLKLNETAMGSSLSTKKVKDLEMQYEYPVRKIKNVNTTFGQRILVHLIDRDGQEFAVFLPPRIVSLFQDDPNMLVATRSLISDKKLCLKYVGWNVYDRLQFTVTDV